MNNKIAIIGKEDLILGFKLLGIETFPAVNSKEAESILDELVDKGYNLVFLTEDLAKDLTLRIKEILEETPISILIIPSTGPKVDIALNMMKESIHRALGAEIQL